MSKNLNYKQVTNVHRRTWDVETYERKAKEREQRAVEAEQRSGSKKTASTGAAALDDRTLGDHEHQREEFRPATAGAAGPEGSKRAYLKAREGTVTDIIDAKVGTSEIVSAEVAASAVSTVPAVAAGASSGNDTSVVKTGVGWHCRVCDCFLKDSHTYLDHINGRKHQKKLGYTMRVEQSTKDQLMDTLKQLTNETLQKDEEAQVVDYEVIVKQKDEELKRRKEERKKKRQERKMRAAQENSEEDGIENEEEEVEAEVDPSLAAMMGFSGFGGG